MMSFILGIWALYLTTPWIEFSSPSQILPAAKGSVHWQTATVRSRIWPIRFLSAKAATSKHLAVLQEAGLIEKTRNGRDVLCSINPVTLQTLEEWIHFYRQFWNERLDALDALVSTKPKHKKKWGLGTLIFCLIEQVLLPGTNLLFFDVDCEGCRSSYRGKSPKVRALTIPREDVSCNTY